MFFKELPIELGVLISNSLSREDQLSFARVETRCNTVVNQPMSTLLAHKLKKAVLANDYIRARQYLLLGANPNYIYDAPTLPGFRLVRDPEPWLAGDKRTLLVLTLYKNFHDMAALLIEHKANVNLKLDGHTTLLHEAAFLLRAKTAKLLIEKGADRFATNKHGDTPAQSTPRCWTQGDEITPRLIKALRHSLVTNTDWEAAISAEEEIERQIMDRMAEGHYNI